MGVAVAVWEETGTRVTAESEEARLVARCQDGDREAQEMLVRKYQEKVYHLAYGLLGHPEEALDACQEVLVAMLRSLARFRGESRFQTWLYRITVNICIMRRRSVRARTRLITEMSADSAQRAWQQIDPESVALSREAQAAVREHLRRLPPEFRAVVVLRELEGLSYDEIAETLSIPLGTVRSRLSRGCLLLREALLSDERIPSPRMGGGTP